MTYPDTGGSAAYFSADHFDIARVLEDERGPGAPQAVRAVMGGVQAGACDPLLDQAPVLGGQGFIAVLSGKERLPEGLAAGFNPAPERLLRGGGQGEAVPLFLKKAPLGASLISRGFPKTAYLDRGPFGKFGNDF